MTINEKLATVPLPVREWFGSEEVTDVIVAIEERFQLPAEDNILSKILFDVITRETKLEELEEDFALIFEVTPQVAREIYEEIKLRILIPIATELVKADIGAAELAFAAKEASVPVPIGPQLDAWSPVLPNAAPTPATPSAPAPLPATSASFTEAAAVIPPVGSTAAPVPLYRDALSSQAYVTPPSWNLGSPVSSGDLAPSSRPLTSNAPPRAAQVDLGAGIHAQQVKMNSFFVERTTPLPQEVDYGAKAGAAPLMPSFSPAAPAPVQAATPAPLPQDSPVITPVAETVPLRAVDEEVPAGGFVDSLMRKVAPWHYAKFGSAKRASEALETPVPAKSVDYSEAPAAPNLQDLTSSATPIDDLPKPPAA